MSFEQSKKILIALDYDDQQTALAFVKQLSPDTCRLKVGKEMFTYFGPEFVKELVDLGFDVFLDLTQLDPNAVLIVSVHRADGSPMPVAAARYPLGTFPRTVVLDDGNAMMQGQKLSSLDKLIVRVRVDSDGNVATRDQDWHGESDVV